MEYINEQYDPAMNWKDAEYCIKMEWSNGIKRSDVSGRCKKSYRYWMYCNNDLQSWWKTVRWIRFLLTVKAISDAVGDKLEIILDGGIRRVLMARKLLQLRKACSFGKAFLFSLGAGGQEGVERLLHNMHAEIRRNMILISCKNLSELNESKIIYRKYYGNELAESLNRLGTESAFSVLAEAKLEAQGKPRSI